MAEAGSESRIKVHTFEQGLDPTSLHRIGDPRPGSPRIFMRATVMEEVVNFLNGDPVNERGGFYYGKIHRYAKREPEIEVVRFVPESDAEGTPTRINTTSSMLQAIEDAAYDAALGYGDMVGWVHSHNGITPAPSETDRDAMAALAMHHLTSISEFFTMIVNPVNYQVGIFRNRDGVLSNDGGFSLIGDASRTGLDRFSITPYISLAQVTGGVEDVKVGKAEGAVIRVKVRRKSRVNRLLESIKRFLNPNN